MKLFHDIFRRREARLGENLAEENSLPGKTSVSSRFKPEVLSGL